MKNQNPLDPLDTNQFTQQLVQFAGVEQQLKTNDQLTTLVSLQQTAQSTQALGFVGKTAVVDGSTTALTNGSATWNLSVPTNSNVNISITNSTGQTVFTGSYSVQAGQNQTFAWDGKGNDGTQWPDGKYTLTATAADTAGNSVAVSTQIQGVVNSVDLTQSPPCCRSTARPTRSTRSRASPSNLAYSGPANFGFATPEPRINHPLHDSQPQPGASRRRAEGLSEAFSRRFVLKPWA